MADTDRRGARCEATGATGSGSGPGTPGSWRAWQRPSPRIRRLLAEGSRPYPASKIVWRSSARASFRSFAAAPTPTTRPPRSRLGRGAAGALLALAEHHQPLLQRGEPEHVVALPRLAEGRERLGRVEVAGVEERRVGDRRQAPVDAVVESLGVAAG